MRPSNSLILNAVGANSTSSSQAQWSVDMVRASFQVVATSASAGGSVQLQASNDFAVGAPPNQFQPTNWTNVGSAATLTGTTPVFIPPIETGYEYLRITYTSTAALAQTVVVLADTGVKQVQTVTTVADVAGSLNNTYFLLSSVNLVSKAQKNFYLWLDDGSGVDPALPGKTGIQVTYSDGDTANTIATQMRLALNGLTDDFVATGAGANVIITNKAYGLVTAAADGLVQTHFTFANTTPGVVSSLTGSYFLLYSGANAISYYVWFNVDGISTDPAPVGKTAIEVDISSGATATAVGTAMASAIAAISAGASFTATGTTTVTVTAKSGGTTTVATDGAVPTHFTFAVTAPVGTISARIKGISL